MNYMEYQAARRVAQFKALSSMLPSFSVPVGDSPYTAPGWLYLGHDYSCVCDPQPDMDVLKAIRRIIPDAMPIRAKFVYQWSNYGELGHLGEPMILIYHGLGRAIKNLKRPADDFRVEMPVYAPPGLAIPGRPISDCTPNWLITNPWHDPDDRPWGQDLPGCFRPFDWSLYYHTYESYYGGEESAQEFEERVVTKPQAEATRSRASVKAENQRMESDRQKFEQRQLDRKSIGDVDIQREIETAGYEPEEPKIQVVVP